MMRLLSTPLLRMMSRPTKWMGLSPFNVLFWHLPPLVKGLQGDLKKMGDLTLRQQIQAFC
jgi:hypothetical protein